MAHFAELEVNNLVYRVIFVKNDVLLDENGVEVEQNGVDFCRNLFKGTWVQTSYNGTFRKNFAGVGFTYDSDLDAFIPPKPFESWVLDEETCQWLAPIPMPEDEQAYSWNEETQQWDLIDE